MSASPSALHDLLGDMLDDDRRPGNPGPNTRIGCGNGVMIQITHVHVFEGTDRARVSSHFDSAASSAADVPLNTAIASLLRCLGLARVPQPADDLG